MTNLSWLIYLAGVADEVGGMLLFSTIVLTILYFVWLVVSVATADDSKSLAFPSKWIIVGAFLIAGVNALIPSQKTVYAIAASELGQAAFQSEAGKELTKEAQDTLKQFLKSLRTEDKRKTKTKEE